MPKNPTPQEIRKKAEIINNLYKNYLVALNKLKIEQNETISRFIKELEQKRIEEIKKILK